MGYQNKKLLKLKKGKGRIPKKPLGQDVEIWPSDKELGFLVGRELAATVKKFLKKIDHTIVLGHSKEVAGHINIVFVGGEGLGSYNGPVPTDLTKLRGEPITSGLCVSLLTGLPPEGNFLEGYDNEKLKQRLQEELDKLRSTRG